MQTKNEPVQAKEPFMKMQWKIGNVQIDNPFVLAPMAGVTDLPFRTLCKEQGAGLICMEMISAKAISFHNKNTIALMEIDPCEHPVSMQLFGSEPDLMAEVAKSISGEAQYIKNKGFDDQYYRDMIIDYLENFGKAQRKDIRELLWDKLPDVLTDAQKERKVLTLLTALKRKGKITPDSNNRQKSYWILTEK